MGENAVCRTTSNLGGVLGTLPGPSIGPARLNPGYFRINLVGTLWGCCNMQTHRRIVQGAAHPDKLCKRTVQYPKGVLYCAARCHTVVGARTLYVSTTHNRGPPQYVIYWGSWNQPLGLQKGALGSVPRTRSPS